MEYFCPNGRDIVDTDIVAVLPGQGLFRVNTFLVTLLNRVRLGLLPPGDPAREQQGFRVSKDHRLIHPQDVKLPEIKQVTQKMMLSIFLTGNDLYKFVKVNEKAIAEYVGDDADRLHNIQKRLQLLHHILSQFFPLSAISGMGSHTRWKTEPHFDEASYNIMHNIMHNEHSPQIANQLLIESGQTPKYSVSPEELFTKISTCGVQINPTCYNQLELRTSGADPQWHPTQSWGNKEFFLHLMHFMIDLAFSKDNFRVLQMKRSIS